MNDVNPIVSSYLKDSTIPQDKRNNVASMLDSGKLSEQDAVGIINQKYAGKYSGGTPSPAKDNSFDVGKMAGDALNLSNKMMDHINPLNYPKQVMDAGQAVFGAAQQGAGMVGQGVQEIASIPGDISNKLNDIKQNPDKYRGKNAGDLTAETLGNVVDKGTQGAADVVRGGLGVGFSPAAVLNDVPVVGDAMKAVGQGVSGASKTAADTLLNSLGIDKNSDHAKALYSAFDTLGQLATVAATEKAAPLAKEFGSNAIEGAKSIATPALEGGKSITNLAIEGAKIVGTKVTDQFQPEPIGAFNKAVDTGIQKGIRPTVVGKSTAALQEKYVNSSREAVKSIINQKAGLKLTDSSTGEVLQGQLPKSLHQFGEAISQAKSAIYKAYSAMTAKAGEQGAKVGLSDVANELDKVAGDQVLQDSNPTAAKYAAEKADILRNRQSYTPEQAEQALKIYNDGLQNYYRNPTPETYAKAHVDALVANHLRTGLDNVVNQATGEQYQPLKNQYGALKAIEKDVNHRATVNSRQNAVPLGQGLADVMSGAEVVHGLLSGSPASIAAGVAAKGVSAFIKRMNDPNIIVKDMFSKGEKYLNKIKTDKAGSTAIPSKEFKSTNPANFKDVFSSDHGANVYNELKGAEAGKSFGVDYGIDKQNVSYKSTFPDWLPASLRNKKLINTVVEKLSNNQLISSEKGKALAKVIKEKVDSMKPSNEDGMPF